MKKHAKQPKLPVQQLLILCKKVTNQPFETTSKKN